MGDDGWLNRLRNALGNRRVVPPVPEGREQVLDGADTSEAPSAEEPDHTASASVFITYGNAKGEDSARVITIQRISGYFGELDTIGAYCHLRKQARNFRLDRITDMICAESGEVLDPLVHCRALHEGGAIKANDPALTHLMRMFTFMARCDGEFHALERQVVEDLVGKYFLRFGGSDAAYAAAVKESPRLAPDSDDMLRALRAFHRMPMRSQLARFAIEGCGMVVDADGVQSPAEVAWAIEVGDALKKLAVVH